MASAFNLLTAGGAQFDKKRFHRDINLFTGTAKGDRTKDRKGKQRAEEPRDLPAPLDLFHTAHHKRHTDLDSVQGESDAESSSSSSSSTPDHPAPPQQKITISGSDPLPKSLHANLPSLVNHETSALSSSAGQPLLTALENSNIHSLWGVQCAVAGCILAGKDTMCVAPTGSGKTLSYVLPTLVRLVDPARSLKGQEAGRGIRSVFVVPTHDLAVQIEGVVKAVTQGRAWRVLVLTKATQKAVCESGPGAEFTQDQEAGETDAHGGSDAVQGGSGLGLDVLIATPERLHHLLEEGQLSLASTRQLVLDESDRLLSTDFLPQVAPIIDACVHSSVQKCFLSATMPAGSEAIAKKWLKDGGVRVVVGIKDSAVSTIAQSLLYTGSEGGKLMALRNLISSGELPFPSLIFTQSIERAEELHQALALEGLRVDSVHGNKAKQKRDEAIKEFREGRVWCLVVTEVLARGMDFRGVKVVVNYDFPQTVQSYIHRIGRTGRAGRPGRAITFFSMEDGPYLRTIANVLRASGCEVPEYMLDMPKPCKNTKRRLAKAPPKRKQVGGGGRDVGKEEGRKKRQMIQASRRKQAQE